MRAAVARLGRIDVEDVPEPVPATGQVLVAPIATGICGSDLHALEALAPLGALAPAMVFGHEFCAEVLDYGPGTARVFAPGTRVCAVPYATGPDGPELVGYSPRFPGGFGERMVLDADRLVAAPSGVAAAHAALTEPLAVALHAVNTARLAPGDPALVLGCGPIGLAVLAVLKAAGHGPVIASDFSPVRRALAERLGADVVIDPAVGSPHSHWSEVGARPLPPSPLLPRASGRLRGATVFECVGAPGILQNLIENVPQHTRVVVVGVCTQQDTLVPAAAVTKELSFEFVFAYRPDEFEASLRMIAEGRIDPGAFVTGTVDLGGVAGAFEELRRPDRHVKVLVRPTLR